MNDELIKTLRALSKVNEEIKEREQVEVVGKSELDDKGSNLKEFSSLMDNMNQIIDALSNSNQYSTREIESLLHKLHITFSDCIWHIDEFHELVKNFIGNFPDSK